MNFISTAELVRDVHDWCDRGLRRKNFSGVVGIPRSGMMVASMIALRLHLPLADLESYLSSGGRFYPGRHGRSSEYRLTEESRGVLVVDDSASAGATMRWAAGEIARHCSLRDAHHDFRVLYGSDQASGIDHHRKIGEPRVFEWNWFRSAYLDEGMIDLDGILCVDPDAYTTGDRGRYEAWLPTATPLHLPLRKVRAVVSARLERYRAETEKWLAENSVRYGDLYLIDATEDERTAGDLHWKHKAWHYGESASPLFVESCPIQAERIHAATGKTVLVPPLQGNPPVVYRKD